jgi:chromosome segregation ATPase
MIGRTEKEVSWVVVMRRPISKSHIRPKISTMPRQKTEAAAFLDLHKITVEKKRLQQELHSLDERRAIIQQRLDVINEQVVGIEGQIQVMRTDDGITTTSSPSSSHTFTNTHGQAFDTLMLDY